MKRLGVAVIGAGFWGRNHARVFKELEMAELLAVCDINRERAKNVAMQFHVDAYTSARRMLKRKDIEAVSICTWSTSLAKEASKALKAGKHVLIEKPMAAKAKEAETLLRIAESEGLHLTVGFLMRFIPGIQYIKSAAENRTIGEVVCATAKRVSQWPERIGDVGVVKDLAIHDIDIMRYIFNGEPQTVYAKTGSMKHRKFEDYAHIMLTFEGGRSAFIESNWLTPYKTRMLVVTGSAAIAKLDYITQELTIEESEKTVQPRIPWQEPLKLELKNFVNCILGREKPLVTGMDGLKALKIAEAALKSSKIGRTVKIK
ncbi:MAG: Gfo/Idh/MocA family oxidoreductase [Candidatus Bathyarchaeia archaeon]